jgi:hypothetical protein
MSLVGTFICQEPNTSLHTSRYLGLTGKLVTEIPLNCVQHHTLVPVQPIVVCPTQQLMVGSPSNRIHPTSKNSK